MSPTSMWLVRHGESTWNIAGLAQGHNDEAELTERGLDQAAEIAGQFHGRTVRAIYASDLRRARQTAAAFAAVLDLPVHDGRKAARTVTWRTRRVTEHYHRWVGYRLGWRACHRS